MNGQLSLPLNITVFTEYQKDSFWAHLLLLYVKDIHYYIGNSFSGDIIKQYADDKRLIVGAINLSELNSKADTFLRTLKRNFFGVQRLIVSTVFR